MPDLDFLTWVNRLKDKHFGGSFQRLANEVGVTFSALKRSVKNGSTSIETLLRICLATGEPPAEVFAAAGKTGVHELITRLYGPAAKHRASARAKELAANFDALTDDAAKKFFEDSLKGLSGDGRLRVQIDAPSTSRTPAGRRRPRTRGTRPA